VRIVEVDSRVRVGKIVFDLVITCELEGRPARLLVRGQAHGYPRDVRNALWQVVAARNVDQPVPDVPMIAAPSITATSRALLRAGHVGYCDSGGSLFVELPGETFHVDRPAPPESRRVLTNPYRGSPARVLETLLDAPDRTWHLDDLALDAYVSISTAHQVCAFLEKRGWMRKVGRGPRATRSLAQPGALLDAWADAHSLDIYDLRRYAHPTIKPWEAVGRLAEAFWRCRIHYGLTLQDGLQVRELSWRAARELDELPIAALVEASPRLDEAVGSAGLAPAEEGATVHLYVTPQRWPRLGSPPRAHHAYVSDVQLYLDLWAWSQVGRQLARGLRNQQFRF
jgi:hypothetical protein